MLITQIETGFMIQKDAEETKRMRL